MQLILTLPAARASTRPNGAMETYYFYTRSSKGSRPLKTEVENV